MHISSIYELCGGLLDKSFQLITYHWNKKTTTW